LQLPVTSAPTNVQLPQPTASNIIGWNENGDNLENYPLEELATSLAFATFRYDTFTGNGSITQFTLSADPVTLGNLDVAISGVTQVPGTDYLLVGGVLQFTSAPANGTVILARYGEGIASGPSMDSYDVRFQPAGTGAVTRTVEGKLRELVSVSDFGASPSNSAAQNATALLAAEASGANEIYVPVGTYNVTGTTGLTKRYFGPGVLVFSGAGQTTFTGSGLNDLSFTGAFVQPRPLQIVIRVNAVNQTGISGAPSPCDTFEYSLNGGATWISTYDAYNPVDDQVYALPLGMNALIGYTLNAPVGLPGTGVVPVFAASTGHTVGNSWAFTLTPNPQVLDTKSGVITKNGSPIMGVNGTTDTNTFLGKDVFGNLKNAGNQNTVVGWKAMFANTTGYANTVMGVAAMEDNTTGVNNTAIGANALFQNTTGSVNTAVGIYASQANTTGTGNVSMGSDTNAYNTTGSGNTAAGTQALYHNTAGSENAAVGLYALRGGSQSFGNGTSQNYCAALGAYSLYNGGGQMNAAIGYGAGLKNTGSYNTYLGAETGSVATEISGGYNVFIGYRSGNNASQSNAGQNSIAIGDGTYTTGGNAVAIGSGVSSPANVFTVCNAFHTFFRPSTDNVTALGGPANRWSVVYAATGAINTSDERQKQQIKPVDDAALRAWAKVEYCQYKFNDAVEKKGAGARWHFGLVAQRVDEAFQSEGLNAFDYGVLCYDEWEAEYEDVTVEKTRIVPAYNRGINPETGQVSVGVTMREETYWEPTGEKKLIKAAGNRYGVRYEEALALECAYLRSKLSSTA